MKHSYLLHSTGDWEKHKYISKDEDNEHYKYSKEQMAEYESHRDEKDSKEEELSEEEKARLKGEKRFEEKAKTAGTSTSDSSKKKSGSSSKQPKSVADMIKTSGKGAAAASKAKAASEKAGKSAKEKAGSTKTAKEKTTKEKTVKEQTEKFDHYTTSSTKVQKALKTYADLGKGDSITSKLDADGNWESTVTYENGDTQTFVMDKKYKILKTGERKTSVQHAMELANDFLIQNGFDEDEEFLEHNGIKGQKWGVKNGPPYPIPDGDHSAAEKKANKYRNIDGSLNEKGIDHKRNYVEKSINKNNRKYQKYIDKYDKKIEKAEDKETKDYYISRKKNAIATRDAVNKYFKDMGIDEIAEQEQMYKEKALKTAGIVAGAAGSVALGIGAPMLIVSGAKFLATIDPAATMESIYGLANTPTGKKAVAAADTAIRAYSDMRAYAFFIYADQTINRIQETGVVNKASNLMADVTRASVNSAKAQMVPNVNISLDTAAAKNSVNELVSMYGTKIKHSEVDMNELYHHGILGQKWGIRRYQNKDGTLTAAGRARLYDENNRLTKTGNEYLLERLDNRESASEFSKTGKYLLTNQIKEMQDVYDEVTKADANYVEIRKQALQSKTFKDFERDLSDKIYDQIGADEWCNTKEEFYTKHASNPSSLHYIWDEDDREYYLINDKRFSNVRKAYDERQKAMDNMNDKASYVASKLIEQINENYGPSNVHRIKTEGDIYARMLTKIKFTLRDDDNHKRYKYSY